ncbi:MAG: hypothetical protein JW779_16020 [Candidatus Thorarchaeota archaeon]|nr:hypothetical protein [Candidatus Thorarchaeota archaeon]
MNPRHNSIRIWTDYVDERVTLALAALDEDCIVVEKDDGYLIAHERPVSLLPLVMWTLEAMDVPILGIKTMRFNDDEESVYEEVQFPESFSTVYRSVSNIASVALQFMSALSNQLNDSE